MAGAGPLPAVTRSGRPLHTPDLTRVGPPELAAAAAESGLTSSFVVPLVAGGEPYGGLQLLGSARAPVEPAQAEAVRPLLAVLVARLVDVGRCGGSASAPSGAGAAARPGHAGRRGGRCDHGHPRRRRCGSDAGRLGACAAAARPGPAPPGRGTRRGEPARRRATGSASRRLVNVRRRPR